MFAVEESEVLAPFLYPVTPVMPRPGKSEKYGSVLPKELGFFAIRACSAYLLVYIRTKTKKRRVVGCDVQNLYAAVLGVVEEVQGPRVEALHPTVGVLRRKPGPEHSVRR